MDPELEARKVALLAECRVDARVFDEVLPRSEAFMEPFVENLVRRKQCEHAVKFVCGLPSDLDHKNVEPSFILATRASGSLGDYQSSFEHFFSPCLARCLSKHAASARDWISIPSAAASVFK